MLLLRPPSDAPSDELVECALQVATRHLPRALLVLSSPFCEYSATSSLLLILLSRNLLWSVQNVCGVAICKKGPLFFLPKPSSYILIVPLSKAWKHNLTGQILELVAQPNWNARASFLVLLLGKLNEGDIVPAVDIVLKELWSNLVTSTTVLVHETEVSALAQLPVEWHRDSARVVARCRRGQLIELHPLFPPPILSGRFRNVTLRGMAGNWPPHVVLDSHRNMVTGIDVEMMRAIGAVEGFHLIEEVLPLEEDWPQLLRRLNEGTIDVAFGGFVPFTQRYISYDASAPYFQDRLRWFITPPRTLTALASMFQTFRPQSWMLLSAMYLTVVGLKVAFARAQHGPDLSRFQSWPAAALDTWRVLMDSALHALPITNRVRLLVAAWILGCMHINQALRSILTSSLSTAHYESSPRTLQELVASGMALTAINGSIEELYGGEPEPYAGALRAVLRESAAHGSCPDSITCLRAMRLRHGSHFGLVISDTFVQFAGRRKAGLLVADIPVLSSYHNVILFRRGNPLRDVVSHRMMQMMQAGLLHHWGQAVLRWSSRHRRVLGDQEEQDRDEMQGELVAAARRERGLSGIGFVLGAHLTGCAMATVCCVLECAVGGRGRRERSEQQDQYANRDRAQNRNDESLCKPQAAHRAQKEGERDSEGDSEREMGGERCLIFDL